LKKVLLIFTILLITSILYAKTLPDKYYEIKSALYLEPENPQGSLGGIKYSKEKDLEIVLSLVDIIEKQKIIDREIKDERRFITNAFRLLLPITEYDNTMEAYNDNYAKCPEPKKTHYLLTKRWRADEAVQFYAEKRGVPEAEAKEAIDAYNTLLNPLTKKEGERKYYKLFKKKVYYPVVINWYLSVLREKNSEIIKFYKKHFKRMPLKKLANSDLNLLLYNFMLAYPNREKDEEIIGAFLKKANKKPKDFVGYDKVSDREKDVLLETLCDEKIIFNIELKKELIEFIKNNKFLVESRNGENLIKAGAKTFILQNNDLFKINDETIKKLKGNRRAIWNMWDKHDYDYIDYNYREHLYQDHLFSEWVISVMIEAIESNNQTAIWHSCYKLIEYFDKIDKGLVTKALLKAQNVAKGESKKAVDLLLALIDDNYKSEYLIKSPDGEKAIFFRYGGVRRSYSRIWVKHNGKGVIIKSCV